ncbi:acetyl esterase/lipase [Dietzia sp. 2505]|uniref:alpha/beta hydrolase n=1 Tax=Dietzia sp. 2505 TaxID=3156457 RepID=UPI003394EAAB
MLPLLLVPPALSTALALSPVRAPFPAAAAGWAIGLPSLEMPLHVGAGAAAMTAARLARRPVTGTDLAGAGLAALTCAGLAVVQARQLAAHGALERAFDESARADAGPGASAPVERTGQGTAGRTTTRSAARRTPWQTVLLQPWPLRPRGVEARTRLAYGPDARATRFDLYTGRDSQSVRGVLIHIHGGHFRAGGPSRESRAMLFDHALRGWAAISTTYHLSPTPEAGFPQHLVDIKSLIRWIRTEGPAHGIPAEAPIVVAGSSAGAHIAMMTALTAGDPRFQPGFEDLDTTLAGAIGLYGYYGRLGAGTKDVSDPVRHPAEDAPPIAIIHGTDDMYTPVKGARRLVRHLRGGSSNPVVYAELPGAQHGFDAVQSARYLAVIAALRRFTDPLGQSA